MPNPPPKTDDLQLLPCPFCGGKAQDYGENCIKDDYDVIQCIECDYGILRFQWNTRTPQPCDDLLCALENIMMECAFHDDEETGWNCVRDNARAAIAKYKATQPENYCHDLLEALEEITHRYAYIIDMESGDFNDPNPGENDPLTIKAREAMARYRGRKPLVIKGEDSASTDIQQWEATQGETS